MNLDQIRSTLAGMIREMFPQVSGMFSDSATFDELGLDSMDIVDLLNSVEERFHVEVSDEKVLAIVGVRELANFLAGVDENFPAQSA